MLPQGHKTECSHHSIMKKKDGEGVWTKILVLPPGRYHYRFSVDGRRVTDPCNDRLLKQPGGEYNNELLVYLPTTMEL